MTPRVYVAAPLGEVERARDFADRCRLAGLHVISSWHCIVEPGEVDPAHDEERTQLLLANLCDLSRADVVLVFTADGTPRATFAEAGYAIALLKPIVWCVPPRSRTGRCLFDSHPLVERVDRDEDVVAAVKRAAWRSFPVDTERAP